jgi:hypothetical protein
MVLPYLSDSIFLHVEYSESLFLALALASILAARMDRWCWAGVLGAFCWMTRGVGAVLLPALAVEVTQQYWARRCWNRQWLWIAVVPAGFAVYLFVNWHVAGNPFAFLQTGKISFEQSFALPLVGIEQALWAIYPPRARQKWWVHRSSFSRRLVLFVRSLVWIKLRPIYAMWMTASLVLFTSVNFLQSIPRYTLTMFPIFILFALLGRNRFWAGVLTVWSLLFFALLAVLFARGEWAF